MRLSVDSYAVRERFGDETAITMLSEAGFDAIDYSMYWWKETDGPFGNDYRAYAKTLRTAAEKNGIIFNQAHSILESYVFDSPSNQERFERILRSIEFASLLGAETIIVHPIRCPMGIDPVSFNVEFFRKFECSKLPRRNECNF